MDDLTLLYNNSHLHSYSYYWISYIKSGLNTLSYLLFSHVHHTLYLLVTLKLKKLNKTKIIERNLSYFSQFFSLFIHGSKFVFNKNFIIIRLSL